MSSKPTYNWPRRYLLDLYAAAVQHGHILVHDLDEEKAASLTMAFYRLRRRSDTSNKTFIPPEYHLVSVGQLSNGTLPIIYTSVPEGSLPRVSVALTGETIPTCTPAPPPTIEPSAPPPDVFSPLPFPLTSEDVTIPEADITDYVSRLRKKVTKED